MWLVIAILVALASAFGAHPTAPAAHSGAAFAPAPSVQHARPLSAHVQSGSGPVGSVQP